MKTAKSGPKRDGDSVETLVTRASAARKLVEAARKHLKIVKAEHKMARRALKQAKKAARRARKQAKAAVKLHAPRNGVKLVKPRLKFHPRRRISHPAASAKKAPTPKPASLPLTSPEDKVITE